MWVYVPSTTSASAQGEADLISASSWQIQALARSCWSRGKPSPARSWLTRWSKAGWLRLLCGRMSEPSTAAHGVASWMASLAASRASLIPSPGDSLARTTSATCGQTPAASSSSPARGGASSRTSTECSAPAGPSGFGETFPDWVSRLRADCSRRRKSARAMGGNGSLSSLWPTASANLFEGDPRVFEARRKRLKAQGVNGNGAGTPLAMAVKLWPTPAARDFKGANGADHLQNGTGRLHLDQLPNFVAHLWQTQSVADTTGGRMTPRVTTGAYTRDGGDPEKERLTLEGQAIASSLQGPTTETPGLPSSTQPRTSRPQLNPIFVEWLMGWPIGWTAFGCSETGWCRYRRLTLTALSSLASPSAALPPQLSLFG